MKTNIESSEFADPVKHLIEDAQELLTVTAHVAEDKIVEARMRLAAAIEKSNEALRRAQKSVVVGAKATDQAIREHPYHSIGIAFGVGVLFMLWARGRK